VSPQLENLTAVGRLREAIHAGRTDVRMLVPTATLAQHRRHQLAREGFIFRPDSIETLSRFATRLAPEALQVSEPLFQLIVDKALRDTQARPFASVSDAPGFPASVARAIRRLDAAGLTAGDLGRICAEWPYAFPLAQVWHQATDRLRSMGMTLRTGVLRAAAHLAKPGGTVLLDGFRKFSAPERELLRSLGAEPETAPSVEHNVRTERFAADSEVREAEEIARRIVEGGVPFREIGIALRDSERSVAVLRPVLERFGIPARFYFSDPLAEIPAVRVKAGTVDAFLSGWDHEVCLPVLRLCSPDDYGDFAVREQIPNSGLAALRKLHNAEVLRDWETLDRKWQRPMSAKKWAEQLCGDLRKARPSQAIADGQDWSAQEWERKLAAAGPLFNAALEEAAALWPENAGAIPLAEYWAAAKGVIEHTALRVNDAGRNVVHVMSVYEARQWTLDTVFICGLAEKAFPKRHSQDAFLPDGAIEKLKRAGFGLDTSSDLDREEEELFRMARQSARGTVVLSYAAEGKNGPSAFWGAVEEQAEAPAAVRPTVLVRPRARRPITRITDAGLIAWMTERRPTYSVTGLENYLGCPFKFFALNMLGLKGAPARPEQRLSFLAEGEIVHKVLEDWLPERRAIRPVLDRVFEEYCVQKRVTHGYRTEAAYARMLADLERFAGASMAWSQNQACAIEKTVEFQVSGGITIRARIDRVERLPDGRVVIIDYKYSNATNTKGKVDDETRLQGPLYVRGIAQGGEVVAAMVYFSLKRSAEAFGWGVVPGLGKQLEALTPEWVETGTAEARRAVDEIRAGSIAVRPVSDAPCKYCEAKDACRKESAAAMAIGVG